jgi:DUF1680 family protein
MKKILTIAAALSIIFSNAQSVYPGQHAGKIKLPETGPVKAYSFDLKDVRLLPSLFTENRERTSKWILSLNVNRLLQSFRNTSGTYSALEGGYAVNNKLGGWESLDCDLRGHTTGHILSALAYLYASTGYVKYKIKADSLVNGLAEVQQMYADNGSYGYISAYAEGLINRNFAGKSVWAPWYTLHKIYAGLIDQYLYCDNMQALEIMKKAASWAYRKLKPLTEEQRWLMLRNEFGGVNEAFYNLYAITANPEHKWLAEYFYHAEVIDPLAEHKDQLSFKHANTFIPKLIGEARNYELFANNRSNDIVHYFWNTVVAHQTYCTGGNSNKEKFIPSDSLSKYLTGYTQETCNTNNMLKLTRHLFAWDADPRQTDFYERALYNHILGQQDPQSGMVAYFLPLLPGAHKVYSTPENSFWCCVGTGFENHSKYGEAIYYHDDNGVYINLFIPSVLTWKEKGVTIKQETDFPSNENVTLIIDADKPVNMPVYLRYPYWAKNVEVKVNDNNIAVQQKPSSYIVINQVWKKGNKIEVRYPMSLHLTPTKDDPNKAAIMYGPLVLAGMMGTDGMEAPAPFSNPAVHNDYYTYDYHVPAGLKTSLTIDRKNLTRDFKKIDGRKLIFTDEKDDVQLAPIHTIHYQRYVVYWELK